jgi:hypothetical protein
MLALIGKITNAAIGWALPGLSANALYIVAGLLFVGLPSAYAWHKGTEGKAAAVATERAACELSKSETARQAAVTMADLLDRIAKAEEDETGTAAEICKRDRFCKSGGKP